MLAVKLQADRLQWKFHKNFMDLASRDKPLQFSFEKHLTGSCNSPHSTGTHLGMEWGNASIIMDITLEFFKAKDVCCAHFACGCELSLFSCFLGITQRISPAPVAYGQLVVGDREIPCVRSSLHAVLLSFNQHQVLSKHLHVLAPVSS